MKTSLRLLLFVLICSFTTTNSYGKGYTIPVHSITLNKYDSAETIVNLQLINNDTLPGNRIDTIKWEFINNGFVSIGWSYTFCDFANCYFPPLPNGATDYLTPRTNGAFTLTVADFYNRAATATMLIKVWDPKDINNPDTISITINATLLGIGNSKLPSSFVGLYPNPAVDYINIETVNAGFVPLKVVIFNSLGKTISEKSLSGSTSRLPVYDLPYGVYIISLRDQYGREARKQFVKE